MTRPLRIQYAGAVYHVTSRGNAGGSIFKEDQDRLTLLNVLEDVNDRYHWLCHAYCLMDNHYHLVIETPDGNLSKGMRHLNGVYTMCFNRNHHCVGHVLQGRYKAILIQKESHLLEVCRYVMLNPIRAKMVKVPEAWKWSSYRRTVGMEKAHPCLTADWILMQFGARRRRAERRFRDFVYDGIGGQTIWKDVKGQSLLGNGDFVDRLIDYVRVHEEVREVPKSQRYVSRPTLEKIFKDVEGKKGKRNLKIGDAVIRWGYNQKEVADHLEMHYSTISRLLKEGDLKISKLKT